MIAERDINHKDGPLELAHCFGHYDGNVWRIAYCVLRIAYCVLRIAYCVLRIAYCVLRVEYGVLRIRH